MLAINSNTYYICIMYRIEMWNFLSREILVALLQTDFVYSNENLVNSFDVYYLILDQARRYGFKF